MDFMKVSTVLDLDNIRKALVRMEDTIVFNLIERSQFFSSPSVYEQKKFPIPNFDGSFLIWMLLQIERTHSQVRRYQAPDEVPFFPNDLLPSFLPDTKYPKILASYSKEINANTELLGCYVNHIVPKVSCADGDQEENWGSVTVCDINCLQAISRRIHFGMFVAEAKYQAEKPKFISLIKARDSSGIEKAITNSAVEEKVLERLQAKSRAYGTDPSLHYSHNPQSKADPKIVSQLYKDYVIPLTKAIEVDYLLRRLEDEPDNPSEK